MSDPDDKVPPPGTNGEFESEPSSTGFGTGQTTGGFTLPPRHVGEPHQPRFRVTAPGLPIERNDAPRPVAPLPRPDVAAQNAPPLELGRRRRPSVILPPIERPPAYGRWLRNILMVVIAFAIAVWALNRFRRMMRSGQPQVPGISATHGDRAER